MFAAEIGESAKKSSISRLFRQTWAAISSSPNRVFLSKTVILPSRVLDLFVRAGAGVALESLWAGKLRPRDVQKEAKHFLRQRGCYGLMTMYWLPTVVLPLMRKVADREQAK
jgi:hypothetical protein